MYMKQFILSFLCLIPGLLFAENITIDEAKTIANKFFNNNDSRLKSVSNAQWELVYTGNKSKTKSFSEAANPALYVFNNTKDKGFIIVAGDDRAKKVLGYSTEDNFSTEDMPVNLENWLYGLENEINYLRSNSNETDAEIKAETSEEIGNVVVDIETALWGQKTPFNGKCPMIGNAHTITGCVTAATVIVMRHHKWPDCGTGTIPGYIAEGNLRVPSTVLGEVYKWDIMPLDYRYGYTDEQASTVASVMFHTASMAKAQFNLTEVNANSSDMARKLKEHMKYDRTTTNLYARANYDSDEWTDMVKKELDENRPIVYSGYTKGDLGHAFVIDGYTDNEYYHVNWGWNGRSNGYFTLGALITDIGTFSDMQAGIFGMKPAYNGVHTPDKENLRFIDIKVAPNWNVAPGGIYTKAKNFTKGSTYQMELRGVTNVGNKHYKGDVVIAVTDAENNIKEVLHTFTDYEARYDWEHMLEKKFSVTINVDIEPGYRIRALYRDTETQKLIPIRGNQEKNKCVWDLPLNFDFKVNKDDKSTVSILPNSYGLEFYGHVEIPKTVTLGTKEYTVTRINNDAFSGCTGITELSLPISLEEIEVSAFADCVNLTKITSLNPTPPSFFIYAHPVNPFAENVYQNATLEVIKGYSKNYKSARNWSKFANIKEIIVTGVENTVVSNATVTSAGNEIIINGAEEGSEVKVFTIDGRYIANFTANGVTASVNVANGIYIVVVDGKSQKVAVQ